MKSENGSNKSEEKIGKPPEIRTRPEARCSEAKRAVAASGEAITAKEETSRGLAEMRPLIVLVLILLAVGGVIGWHLCIAMPKGDEYTRLFGNATETTANPITDVVTWHLESEVEFQNRCSPCVKYILPSPDYSNHSSYNTRIGMSPLLWIAAFAGVWVGVTVLWDLAMVATLRFFDIKLPFAFSIHFYPGRERKLLAALKGRNKNTHVLVSGFLFFAFPMFVGFASYQYILKRYTDRWAFGLGYVGGLTLFLVICASPGSGQV
jgi:hypothetical protein